MSFRILGTGKCVPSYVMTNDEMATIVDTSDEWNISAVMQDRSPKDVIIAINDNAQDGIDISWLWDVDFDRFSDESVRSITVSGIRCQDMRLRMKYVDIPSVLEADVEKAIRDRVEDGTGNLYVLVNYTALFSTRNILKKLEGEHK